MATQKDFYHADTEKKLKAIEAYLQRYLFVFKNQPSMETIYVDAFAGSGSMPVQPSEGLFDDQTDTDEFVLGSALRALRLEQKFNRYIFIEEKKSRLDELKDRLAVAGADNAKVEFIKGNANDELLKLCPYLSRGNVRAVVFLDPFGNQVGWDLLEALGQTKHVDLWYLFPAMLGVYRQIKNLNAKTTDEGSASLDRLFGPNDWRSAFIKRETGNDLFGPTETQRKIADVEDITRFMIKCMNSIFAGRASNSWMPLGRSGAHWYSLIFAMANPARAATKIGHAMANHIMTHK